MKGIYLTEEAKQKLEAKIDRLIKNAKDYKRKGHTHRRTGALGSISVLQDVLSSAVVLPIEEGWHKTYGKNNFETYPNGVIIKPE